MQTKALIQMDLLAKGNISSVNAVQGDTAREIVFSLYSGGLHWEVPQNAAVLIRYRKNDGTKGVYDTLPDGTRAWDADGNRVSLILAPQVLTVAGVALLQVSIYVSDQERALSTFAVTLNVEENVAFGVDTSEDYVNIGEFILPKALEAANRADESAELSERYSRDAYQHFVETQETYGKVEAISENILDQAIQAALSLTSQMNLVFEYGDLSMAGEDIDSTKAIRSSFFPLLSQSITIAIPYHTRWSFYCYDQLLQLIEGGVLSDSDILSTTVTPPEGTYFLRLVAQRDDSALIEDVDEFASSIAVYAGANVPDSLYDLTISVYGNETDGYQANHTLNDIQDSEEKGQKIYCKYSGMRMPLKVVKDGVAYFTTTLDGVFYQIELSDDGVSVSKSDGVFYIVFDGTEGNYGLATTRQDIVNAHSLGREIKCKVPVDGGIATLQLVHFTENANATTFLFGGATSYLDEAEGGKAISAIVRISSSGVEYGATLTPMMSNGVYIVNVTLKGNGTYSVDKGYEGVLAMYNEGVRPVECRIKYGGVKYALPLRAVEDGQLVYSGISGGNSLTVFHNSTEGITVVFDELSENGGGNGGESDVFRVIITAGDDGAYTADKTFGEVLEAHEANKAVQCEIELTGGTFVLPLCNWVADEDNMYLVYGGSAGNQSLAVFHTISEKITVFSEVLALKSYVDEAIANIPTGDPAMELIASGSNAEAVRRFRINVDNEGNAFELKKAFFVVKDILSTGVSGSQACHVSLGGTVYNAATLPTESRNRDVIAYADTNGVMWATQGEGGIYAQGKLIAATSFAPNTTITSAEFACAAAANVFAAGATYELWGVRK